MNLVNITAILSAYLIGSIPTGIIVTRAMGAKDPRSMGSGNIGATNVGRSAGRMAAIVTLIGDVLKGSLPALFALYFLPSVLLITLTAFAAFLGHIFPIFLGFKGGKGVATALGIFLIISPLATLLSGVLFILIVLLFRYVSLGSLVAGVSMPLFLTLLPQAKPFVPLGTLISVVIILKHTENIRRLAQGKENRIGRR